MHTFRGGILYSLRKEPFRHPNIESSIHISRLKVTEVNLLIGLGRVNQLLCSLNQMLCRPYSSFRELLRLSYQNLRVFETYFQKGFLQETPIVPLSYSEKDFESSQIGLNTGDVIQFWDFDPSSKEITIQPLTEPPTLEEVYKSLLNVADNLQVLQQDLVHTLKEHRTPPFLNWVKYSAYSLAFFGTNKLFPPFFFFSNC